MKFIIRNKTGSRIITTEKQRLSEILKLDTVKVTHKGKRIIDIFTRDIDKEGIMVEPLLKGGQLRIACQNF